MTQFLPIMTNSVATQNALSRPNFSLPWPVLSRHKMFCHDKSLPCLDKTRRHTVMRASLRTHKPIVCGRAFCCGQLYSDLKFLCRGIISPHPGQLYRYIELLCRDIISPCLGQLCHYIKYSVATENLLTLAILCLDIKRLCHDIKRLCRDIKGYVGT